MPHRSRRTQSEQYDLDSDRHEARERLRFQKRLYGAIFYVLVIGLCWLVSKMW